MNQSIEGGSLSLVEMEPSESGWIGSFYVHTEGGELLRDDEEFRKLRIANYIELPDGTKLYYEERTPPLQELKNGRRSNQQELYRFFLSIEKGELPPPYVKAPIKTPIEYVGVCVRPRVDTQSHTVTVDFTYILSRLQKLGLEPEQLSLQPGGALGKLFGKKTVTRAITAGDIVKALPTNIDDYDGWIRKNRIGAIGDFPVELHVAMPQRMTKHSSDWSMVATRRSDLDTFVNRKRIPAYPVTKTDTTVTVGADHSDDEYFSPLDVTIALVSPTQDTLKSNPHLDVDIFRNMAGLQQNIAKAFASPSSPTSVI